MASQTDIFKFCKYLCLEKTNPSWQFVDVLCSSLMMQCNRLFLQSWFYVKSHIVKNIQQFAFVQRKDIFIKNHSIQPLRISMFYWLEGSKSWNAKEAHPIKLCKNTTCSGQGKFLWLFLLWNKTRRHVSICHFKTTSLRSTISWPHAQYFILCQEPNIKDIQLLFKEKI